MSEETIVAVYDTEAHARAAVAGLKGANVPDGAISMHAGTAAGTGASTGAGMGASTGAASTATGAAGMGATREQGFWSSLFGGEPDHDTAVYDRSLAGGSTVVSVKVPDAHVAQVVEILESHHPIDIDERATGYGLNQTTRTTTVQPLATPVAAASVAVAPVAAPVVSTVAGGDSIQLAEESLVVGKRVVNRGGTRIRRYVVETPVEQDVTLRAERVTLERRPVNDGRLAADSFAEKTIEMTQSAEEVVVGKTARVVEEVSLRKEAAERVETVRDTVRKEAVEVVQLPGTQTTTGATTTGAVPGGTPLTPRAPKI